MARDLLLEAPLVLVDQDERLAGLEQAVELLQAGSDPRVPGVLWPDRSIEVDPSPSVDGRQGATLLFKQRAAERQHPLERQLVAEVGAVDAVEALRLERDEPPQRAGQPGQVDVGSRQNLW